MKKITRLLNHGGKNRKNKSATQYNVFDSNACDSKATKSTGTAPIVHNYNKTITKSVNKVKTNKLQLQSKSQLAADININYASLNRVRKQRKRRRHLFVCLCCCCCRNKYKGFWRPTRKSPKSQLWPQMRSWMLRKCCCQHKKVDDDDDDIDGKFAAYICEMKVREQTQAEQHIESTPYLESVIILETNANSSIETLLPTQETAEIKLRNKTSTKFRVWTWDDSLRSNSDRFLETLEQDPVLTTSSREEAKAASEELNRSPTVQQKSDPTASPLQSRASNDVWPAQSDEDIDRLVALHQNRHSLSSLGVNKLI